MIFAIFNWKNPYVCIAHHSSEEETVEKSIVDNGANGIDKK